MSEPTTTEPAAAPEDPPLPEHASAAEVLLRNGVAIEAGERSVRYVLPEAGHDRRRAFLQLTLGLLATVALIVVIISSRGGGEEEGPRFLFDMFSPYLEMSVFFALAIVADAGRRLVGGRRVIELSPDMLTVYLHTPLLQLRRRRRLGSISRLVITDPRTSSGSNTQGEQRPWRQLLREARLRVAAPWQMAITLEEGDRQVVAALGEDLVEQAEAFGVTLPLEREDTVAGLEAETRVAHNLQPAEPVHLEPTADGFYLRIDPPPFPRSWAANSYFAVAAVLVIGLAVALALLWPVPPIVLWIMGGPIGVLATYLVYRGYAAYDHTTTVLVNTDGLEIKEKFGLTNGRDVFVRSELDSIVVPSSDNALLVVDREGAGHEVSVHRPPATLQWLAALLRQELELVGSARRLHREKTPAEAEPEPQP